MNRQNIQIYKKKFFCSSPFWEERECSREVKKKGKNKKKIYNLLSQEMQEEAPVVFSVIILSTELVEIHIQAIKLEEINPEYSLEGLFLKLKLQYFGHLI